MGICTVSAEALLLVQKSWTKAGHAEGRSQRLVVDSEVVCVQNRQTSLERRAICDVQKFFLSFCMNGSLVADHQVLYRSILPEKLVGHQQSFVE